jgi:hypothetical protein
MSESLAITVFGVAFLAFLGGVYGERWRAKMARRRWQRRQSGPQGADLRFRARNGGAAATAPPARANPTIIDAEEQLRIVSAAQFKRRPILSKLEARVLYWAEEAIKEQGLRWRAMAQVSLGEVLSSVDARAYGAINSKRADILLVAGNGDPMLAIEYQGSGHYQGSAPARDAVKREALRKAGIRYFEMTPDHAAKDLAREIARIAALESANSPRQS